MIDLKYNLSPKLLPVYIQRDVCLLNGEKNLSFWLNRFCSIISERDFISYNALIYLLLIISMFISGPNYPLLCM